jgi:DNA polymerase (family X)
MAIRNRDIAGMLNEIADLLDIRDANSFRVRSYRNAARTVGSLNDSVADLVERGEDLSALPDIGDSIAAKLEEIVATGRVEQLEELRQEMDADVTELLRIPNVGPAGARTLYGELGITSAEGIIAAAEQGQIAELSGFGEKTQSQLARDARTFLEQGARDRMLLGEADEVVAPLLEYLRSKRSVRRAVAAGSYRRRKETIGDVDILVESDDQDDAMDALVSYERVESVVSKGSTRSTVILTSGLHVDLRAVASESFGAALHYFTGSKEHNVAVRRVARERGLKINEYGVFDGEEQIAGKTEESVFQRVDLPWICPELRENRGELQAARDGALPELIELDDIRGDLHVHTKASDGKNTVAELAEAARDRGYEYLAITDHSVRVRIANGLDEDRLAEQIDEVRRVNEQTDGIEILAGIEVEILRDGSLDLPDDLLSELDVVVAAVHYDRDLGASAMTDRVVRAITEHPVSIFAHPTGRLLGQRDPYEIDLDPVYDAAASAGVWLELNGNPERIDLSDRAARAAVERGVRLVISTDAHSADELSLMRYGVDTARRGWVTAAHVMNTRSLDDFRAELRGGGANGG